jgi:mannose-6-phosphate isomerase-like protein (cupin superfamily)
MIQPGVLLRYAEAPVLYRERLTPESGHLDLLSCGEYQLAPAARGPRAAHPDEEALLAVWFGAAAVEVAGAGYALAAHDMLYIPKGAPYRIANPGREAAGLWLLRAPAEKVHPVVHARFATVSAEERRIRRLKGKTVYLMFDVTEAADKLVAGYTFFEPFARSWPPHNHTDQEEIYIFLEGRGAMEVYESPETLTFVREVSRGDAVTIPRLNYHPVFSQDERLEFLWSIAGARYWVGDKSREFMAGTAPSVTT